MTEPEQNETNHYTVWWKTSVEAKSASEARKKAVRKFKKDYLIVEIRRRTKQLDPATHCRHGKHRTDYCDYC